MFDTNFTFSRDNLFVNRYHYFITITTPIHTNSKKKQMTPQAAPIYPTPLFGIDNERSLISLIIA